MLSDERTLMASLTLWIDVVVVLVLDLLVLLLQLSLVLLHLLGSTGMVVSMVVQVHLLLDVDVVLR